jgi:AraC family transcriptional activator of tynA and feaB
VELVAGEFWTTGPADAAIDQWQQMLSRTHLPWSVSVPQETRHVFEASARRWWIGDLALVDCECGPCSGTRRHREIVSTDGEFVVVLITRSGRESVTQRDSENTMDAGDAVIWDSTKPARFRVWEQLSKRSLLIPTSALDEVNGRAWLSGGLLLNRSAPGTRLLTGYLDTLSQTLPDLSSAAICAARNATLELLIGALRTDGEVPTSRTARPALRAAMDRYIAAHLLNESVTPRALANAHGVSVRTVNRVFNATGETVSEVVRVRRLARARAEIAAGRDSITAIAARWGFADSSHLSRSFKAHYGSCPSEYREHAIS